MFTLYKQHKDENRLPNHKPVGQALQFKDNRAHNNRVIETNHAIEQSERTTLQKAKIDTLYSSPLQKKEADDTNKSKNETGLPDQLKTGIESLSGIDISDTRVHYNSDKPAQLQAHAYAQGNEIHIAPGQEKHLPHEAWHVVQQKQGRVQPTMQMKGKVNINDDDSLEKEADIMGAKALSHTVVTQTKKNTTASTSSSYVIQKKTKKLDVKGAGEVDCYWEPGGSMDKLKIDNLKPSTDFLVGKPKEFFENAIIADVDVSPDKTKILVFPKNTKHGIFRLQPALGRGNDNASIQNPASWAFFGQETKVGVYGFREDVAYSHKYMNGIEGLTTVKAIADKIYDNMLGKLEYIPVGSSVDGIIKGDTKGMCHAVNSAMGILIQAGLASRDKSAVIKNHTHETPFLTPDRQSNSIIKGAKTNIIKYNDANYNGHRIKFDNHQWISVAGKVYDLVAGIKNGAASAIDKNLEIVEPDKKFKWGSKTLTKVQNGGTAPWGSGYAMADEE